MKSILYYAFILIIILNILPETYAQWVQTNGPFGGTVKCFAVSDSKIIAGTSYGGVFISSNNGMNWTKVNNGLTDLDISALFISDTITFAASYYQVFLSSDNGNNWAPTGLGFGIKSFAKNKVYLFAGGNTGVFRSSNNGINWDILGSGTIYHDSKSIIVIDSVIIVGASDNIIRSSDNGNTWDIVGNINDVSSFVVKDSTIYASSFHGLYHSTNMGISWSLVSNKHPFDLPVISLAIIGSKIFAASRYDGVFVSSGNDTIWTQVNNGLSIPFMNSIYSLSVKGTNIFLGTICGVFRSSDYGSNWTQINEGITASTVNLFASRGDSLFAGTKGVYLTTNNGADWIPVNNGLPPSYGVSSLAFCGNNLFAGSGGVFRSTNNGIEWTNVSNGIRPSSDITSIAVTDNMIFIGTSFYAGGGPDPGEIYLSTNNGVDWTLKSSHMTLIASLFISGNYIFAGTGYYGGSYRSKIDAIQWFLMDGFTETGISSFAALGSTLFANLKDSILISTNNGVNWSKINNSLLQSISDIITKDDNIFASSYSGNVFHSTDAGATWTTINGLPMRYGISKLWIAGDYIYAGTSGTGVWRRLLSDITGISNGTKDLPKNYELSQNYPNPFNPSTSIRFSLPEPAFVKLNIYNLLGEEIGTLVNEYRNAGNYTINFNSNNLSSGIYIYRISAGKYNDAKKMILLK